MGTNKSSDTDQFLALHFPHLPKSWLQRVNEKLGRLKADPNNGGNVELCTRFNRGRPKWWDWRERELADE